MGIDTRIEPREPVSSSVELVISDSVAKMIKLNVPRVKGDNAVVIKANLVDINTSGCGVEAPFLIPTGLELDIKVDAAPLLKETGGQQKEPITASCKVVSCSMKEAGCFRLGLSFTAIPEPKKALIENFIKVREDHKNAG